jgi:hypothetical protein
MSTGGAHLPFISGFSAYVTLKLAAIRFFEYLQFENPTLRGFPDSSWHDFIRYTGKVGPSSDGYWRQVVLNLLITRLAFF